MPAARRVAGKGVDRLVERYSHLRGVLLCNGIGKESDKSLATAFSGFARVKGRVAYPFLLALYHDY